MVDVPQAWQNSLGLLKRPISWLSEQWVSSEILESISVQLFLFHPAVLEPNLHLSVCKTEHSWQLQAFLFVYVHIEKEFSFKFSDLVFGIRASLLSGLCRTRAAVLFFIAGWNGGFLLHGVCRVLFGLLRAICRRVTCSISRDTRIWLLFGLLGVGLLGVCRLKKLIKSLWKYPVSTDVGEETARGVSTSVMAVHGIVLKNHFRSVCGLQEISVHYLLRWIVRSVIAPVMPFARMIQSIVPESHFANRLDLRYVRRIGEIDLTRRSLRQKRRNRREIGSRDVVW